MNRVFQSLLNRIPWLHPGIEDVLSWCDGHLHPDQARRVAAHLARCQSCRWEAGLFLAAARRSQLAASDASPDESEILDHGFQSLYASMRAWRSLQGSAQQPAVPLTARSVIRRRIATTVRFYFGAPAASRIEGSAGSSQGSDQHLLPATKALFSAFLGRRAAEALAREIARSAA